MHPFHLKAGAGLLCAGQTKLKGEPIFVLNDPKVSELVENFGDEVPTGSRKCFIRTEPVNWDGTCSL